MKKRFFLFYLLMVLFIYYAAGCEWQGDPEPEAKKQGAVQEWTQADVDEIVEMTQVSIPAAAPRENGTPPEACDYIRFLRFKLKSMPDDASEADAVLLMIPGVVEGANGFEYIARQLIYVGNTQYGKNFEVWGFDRRNNCLEDTTGIDAIEASGDISTAEQLFIDYYYNGAEVNGRVFEGFLKSEDMPYLSEFGLKMDTEDIYTIITTMIPDPEVRRKKVFVGGHSMGGMHTSFFAGWDFDGDPATTDDAGYRNCAGLFALDSTLVPISSIVEEMLPEDAQDETGDGMTQERYERLVSRLRDGQLTRAIPFLDGEVGALMESAGYLAHMAPGKEHTAVKNVPYSDNVDMLNRFFHSRTLGRFLSGTDDLKEFRYTNEALVGILFDDDFAPIGMIQTSMGFLHGGGVVEKDFPLSDSFQENMPGLADLLASFLTGSSQHYIATESGQRAPLYTWANFDEIGTNDDPEYQSTDGSVTYTTITDEVTDIQDFARALYIGPSNLIEWYFSTRRLVDLLAAVSSYGPEYGLNFMHADQVENMPQIEFPAGDTFVVIPGTTGNDYEPMEGYNHMDPMFASVDRPGFKESEVIRPLIEFVLDNVGE